MQTINNNMQQQSFKPVSVYFKEAFTSNTKMYQIYPDWTLNLFIYSVTPLISVDFGLELNAFELLDMGQELAEHGAALRPTDSILLRNMWTPELNVCFYIRRL